MSVEVPPNSFGRRLAAQQYSPSCWEGTEYESKVSLGYLNQSFQNAVMEGFSIWIGAGSVAMGGDRLHICFE